MPKQYNQPSCEWSYHVSTDDMERAPKTYNFEADEEERANLSRRLGVDSIESASASVTVQKLGGGVFHAIGNVEAEVTQHCVVSLVPIKNRVSDEFEGWFSESGTAVNFAKAKSDREVKKGNIEVEVMDESIDPEPIVGGQMDIGELATQYLSLAIDPYPHAEGVASEFVARPPSKDGQDAGADIRKNPFEALKDWKEKR